MSATARARLVGHRHRVDEVVADQRLYRVEQVGQQHPVRRLPVRDDVAVSIRRLEDDQIIGDVHAFSDAAGERVGALGAAPELGSLDTPRGPHCLSYGRSAEFSRDADPGRFDGESSVHGL